MKFEDALAAFLRSRVDAKRRTIDWYRQQIEAFHKWLIVQPWNGSSWLRPETIELFLEMERARGLEDSTIRARHRALKIFFAWLKKRGYLSDEDNPMLLVKLGKEKRKLPRVSRPDQVAGLLASIRPADWLDLRDRTLIMLLDQTGVRVSEAVGVQVKDVDIVARTVTVLGKDGNWRIVPFRPALSLSVLELVQALDDPRPGSWLFVSGTGHRGQTSQAITDNGVRQMLRKRCEAAGITYLNPHAFRHGLAMKLMNRGRAPTSLISSVLGHASEKTTERFYAHWENETLVNAYDEAMGRADD